MSDGVPTARRAHIDATTSHKPIVLSPARYLLLPLAQTLTGYTVKAMQRKIARGDWQEGKIWRHAPDGHVLIDMVGYQQWAESR